MNIQEAAGAIREAETCGMLGEAGSGLLSGYSGRKLIGALQRLCLLFEQDASACYLEIGVFQGLTLLSVASAVPAMPCHGIDNFAFFDPAKTNLGLIESRRAQLGTDNAFLINQDYEDAFEGLDDRLEGRKIAVLFVDGPHDYRSQSMCLQLALPFLHENAVLVVDDSNYRHVRQANRDFLATHPQFKLLFESYTRCHPANMNPGELALARDGWWNGVNIIVRDEDDLLPQAYPPTDRSRVLYENEHDAHASGVAHLLPLTDRLLCAIDRLSPLAFAREAIRLKLRLRKSKAARTGLYRSMNTFSEDLPASRYNGVDP